MRKNFYARSRAFALGGALLGLALLAVWWFVRTQDRGRILYLTTLPLEPGQDVTLSVAELHPASRTCAPPVYLDRALPDVVDLNWSPRRDQILYTTLSAGNKTTSLWLMRPDGSERRQIMSDLPEEILGAHLSADERYAVFVKPIDPRDYQTFEVWVWDSQDKQSRRVKTGVYGAQWSPRDAVLAILKSDDDIMYLMRPDGTVAGRYAASVPISPGFEWSPDGRRIVFVSSGPPGDDLKAPPRFVDELFALDLSSGQTQQLMHSGDQYIEREMAFLAWSPDGKRIAYVASVARPGEGERYYVLFLLEVESGREQEVAEEVRWSAPVWSPDGKHLAYVSAQDGPKDQTNYGQVYVRDVETGATVQLTCDDKVKTSLSW